MNSKNVIEVNGKRYDAVSGNLLGTVSSSAPVNATIKPSSIAPNHQRKTVDGIFRPQRPVAASQLHKKVVQLAAPRTAHAVTKPVASSPRKTISVTHTANHAVHHKVQTAQTLMRSAVTKPGVGFKKQAHVQTALQHNTPSLLVKKTSVHTVTPERMLRAKATAQSHHISKFDHSSNLDIPVTMTDLPVQPAPNKSIPAVPGAPAPSPSNQPMDMFEHALANASGFIDTKAHRAQYKKKSHRHVTSMAAGMLALFVIVGFAAYQNTPGLQIKVASIQAGVSTHTPNFAAAGFAYKGVSSQSGKVTVGFASGGNSYQLTQQTTNWTSDDMISNVASVDASGQPNYQTVQAGATSVYRFNDTGATWVKNGNWYQITGQQPLTDSQVQALAANS